MASISSLRDALRNQIRNVSGLEAYDVLSPQPQPTAATVFPKRLRRATAGGLYQYDFVIEVIVPLSLGLENAQDALDNFIDPEHARSIEAAIEADKTLGGVAHTTQVDGFESYHYWAPNSSGGPTHLMASIPVEVYA